MRRAGAARRHNRGVGVWVEVGAVLTHAGGLRPSLARVPLTPPLLYPPSTPLPPFSRSGKTFTMVGSPSAPGVTPRAVERLFALLAAETARTGGTFRVEATLVELYLDALEDLAHRAEHPRGRPEDAPKLEIKRDERGCVRVGVGRGARAHVCVWGSGERERACVRPRRSHRSACPLAPPPTHPPTRPAPPPRPPPPSRAPLRLVTVKGATVRECPTPADALAAFAAGNAARRTGSTRMNAESSRSHLLFSLQLTVTNPATRRTSHGKLTLIDLAGSERVAKTGATEERLREAAAINRSLSALGNVISALSAGDGGWVPYRDHKLTMLLADSLGGNAKTLMFVNVSPAAFNAEETGTSLAYAARVKLITNSAERASESAEVARLRAQVAALRAGRALAGGGEAGGWAGSNGEEGDGAGSGAAGGGGGGRAQAAAPAAEGESSSAGAGEGAGWVGDGGEEGGAAADSQPLAEDGY